MPVGAYARFAPGTREMTLSGMVANLDGTRLLRRLATATIDSPARAAEMGDALAGKLLDDGCGEILDEVLRRATGQPESDE